MESHFENKINQETNFDKIAKRILLNMQEIEPDKRYKDAKVFIFKYGQKQLKLFLEPKKSSHSFLENIKEDNFKEKNETRMLYLTVKKFLKQKALDEQCNINYKIMTENKSVKKWANTAGR